MPDAKKDFFEMLVKVLLRCWMLGVLLLLIWIAALLLSGGPSSHFAVVSYGGTGLFTLLVLTFFFIPWAAIKYVLRYER